MNNRMKWFLLAFILVAACLTSALAPSAAAQQEPVVVGRIAYIEGQLLRYVPESKDWVIVTKDAPFGLNDALYSDSAAKAEFTMPNGLLVRIGGSTQMQLIVLKSDVSEMDVASGVARFYNRNPNGMLKVTTPFGYVFAGPDSTFDLYVGDQSVEVLGLNGGVDYFQQGTNAKYEVIPGGASILADATQVADGAGTLDAQWDDWNAGRDTVRSKRVEVRGETIKYVPPQLQDEAADLDQSGTWEKVTYQGEVREVWRPTAVEETWRPFTVGRWTDYYGDQVWVPDEPFGYVTHHYGNWLLVDGRWYWAPPAPVVEVAAGPSIGFGWYPGRVAWISSDADVGWVPLAPTEIYYSNHYWGPSAVVVSAGPAVAIGIGGLAFASAAVVVPQASFYSVSNYSSVRVANINRTTIVNDFHAAPVVNNTVVKNYNQSTAKYNFVNKAPEVKPHATVTERISQNQRAAATDAKSLSARTLKQTTEAAKPVKPAEKAAVPAPTKLTNKLVPANQVNAPKDKALFKTTEMKKTTKPVTASPAAKAGGAAGAAPPPAPGVAPPPKPGVTPPPKPGAAPPPAPGVTPPPKPGVTPPPKPGAAPPPAPGVTPPPKPGAAPPPAPGVTPPPKPGVTPPPKPGVAPPPKPAPAPKPEVRTKPAPAPKPSPAPAAARPPAQQQPDKKKQQGQQ
ncbi:MAG: DUF6600 domain-containing protein [Syntrophobacteraceae bacterium]